MARKRSVETETRILDASWRSFMSTGYKATSYTSIAEATGINRATVQSYFPKKETMAAMNLERLRVCADEAANAEFRGVSDPFARHYILGQIYIAALLSSEQSRLFLHDTLEDRALTFETIARDLDWSMIYVLGEADGRVPTEEELQTTVAAMGGFYELLFYVVKNDKDIDIAKQLSVCLRSFARLIGLDPIDCEQVLASYAVADDRVRALGKSCYDKSFVTPIPSLGVKQSAPQPLAT